MAGFSKSINNRFKKVCKRKQSGKGKIQKTATMRKFKKKPSKAKKAKKQHRAKK